MPADFAALTPAKLAQLLQISESELQSIAQRANRSYRVREELKKHGGVRIIEAPSDELKKIQRTLLKRVFQKIPLDLEFFGVKGTRMVDAISMHCQKPLILCLDVQNFFPTVRRETVGLQIRSRGIPSETANQIVRLTTLKGRLPQGAPTSPLLAALALQPAIRDIKSRLGAVPNLDISVYVDDITISGPENLKKQKTAILAIFDRRGFPVHPRKTRFMRPDDPPEVLGVKIAGRTLETTEEFECKLADRISDLGRSHSVVRGMLEFKRSLSA